jgi:hypothetical protein
MDQDVVVTRRRQVGGQPRPVAPLSCVTNSARSVPAKSTFGLPGYSARPRTDASSAGSPLVTASRSCRNLRAEDVRLEVAVAMGVERDVSRATRRRGRDDVADEGAVF